jgi:hypothetical protein
VTTQTAYRFLCDAPDCTQAELRDGAIVLPPGWRRLDSTDHIEPRRSSPDPAGRGDRLTYSEQCIGAFALHLCPEHHDAFDTHLPRTDGRPGRRGRDATVTVSCGCGAIFGYTSAGIAIGRRDCPASTSENLWWRHLPVELQAYVNREAS